MIVAVPPPSVLLPPPGAVRRAAYLGLVLTSCTMLAVAAAAHAGVASDPWITQRAKMHLLLSPEVDASALHVDSTNGRVTLFGAVASEAGKAAATRIAGQVIGVRSVRNLLTVVPPAAQEAVALSDRTLAENVGLALRNDPALAASNIHVASVDAGTVVLGGRAASFSEQYRALRLARDVAGVRRIASVIEGPQVLCDAEIWGDAATAQRSAAADAWLANAVKVQLVGVADVPALDVAVDAHDGVVTLFGIVPSDAARAAAERAARGVAGVQRVENALLVREAAAAEPPTVAEARAAAAAALAAAPLDDADVIVTTHGEALQVSGRVATQADHLTALTVARRASGGRAVIDALQVAPAADAAAPAGTDS